MKKRYSGMDAWRYIVRTSGRGAKPETYLPLILAAAGALGIIPFAAIRIIQRQWFAAGIDIVIILSFAALAAYVYVTHRVRAASVAIAILCVAGVLSTVYLIGPQQVYWTFPTLLAIFYLIRPIEAILCATIMIVALLPAILPAYDPQVTMTLLTTTAVTSAFAFAFSLVTSRQREQLLLMATRDPLTGAGNRRGLDLKLTDIINLHRRTGTPASIVLIDLDHFKRVNDIHGHGVGDQVLKSLTEIINLRIRVTDSLYRIGGEEFVVVLEGADREQATQIAEQLRKLVEANELVADPGITISLGVAELKAGETAGDWLHRADEALYQAKDAGRNVTSISD